MMLKYRFMLAILAVLGLGATLMPGSAKAVEIGGFELNGYVRHYMSFNLDDVPETSGDDKYKMSMNRLTLLGQLRGNLGPATLTAIGRVSREQMTDYLNDLEDSAVALGGGGDFQDEYNEAEIRELYLDIPIGERVKLRLGKQQVVWGETDFFQALDVVHGYNQTWRSFLEPENEEWRKPLILTNVEIDVPELKGGLQLLWRPGFDDEEDIGNSYDMFGGRWSQNGSKGFDLNADKVVDGIGPIGPSFPFDYHHPEGDTDDAHYGARWSGTLGANDDLAYSLNYYHTQAQNPVLYPSAEKGIPTGYGLAFIHPEIDIYGGSLSGYIPFLDAVYRFEAAYIPENPFNDNFGGLVKKDTLRTMFGLDTNLRLQNVLGTSSPSMFTLQVFDTYIDDYKAADMITNAFGTTEDEHTAWVSSIFTLPYKMDTITFQSVTVNDVSNGGGVFAPSVEFQFGPSWRVKCEADLFYGGTKSDTPGGASLFGSFDNNDQFLTRITYQF